MRIPSTGKATYPDAGVFCGSVERDPKDPTRQTATNPVVLVEVLSPTTASYDRGDKLDQYQTIESVRAVLLVDHEIPRLEMWQRSDRGEWSSAGFLIAGFDGDNTDRTFYACSTTSQTGKRR